MADKKQYDFSDFDVPKPAGKSKSYDFSDFDDPTAEAPVAPKYGKSIDDDISRISSKYTVDPQWLRERQIGMGYYPEEQAKQLISQGMHGEHLGNAAMAAVNGVVGEGLMGGLPAWVTKKMSSDNEAAALDELRDAVDHHKSGTDMISELALSAAPSAAASKVFKAGKLGNAAINIGEAARAGVMESNEGDELGDAVKSGGLVAGLAGLGEAIPRGYNWVADKVGNSTTGKKIANWAGNKAGEKAVEALNPTLSQQERLANTKNILALGQRLLKEKVITPFASPKSMLERLEKSSDRVGREIGTQLKEVDKYVDAAGPEIAQALRISPTAVADRLQTEVVDKYKGKVAFEDLIGSVEKEIEKFRRVAAPWSFAEANAQKTAYGSLLKWGVEEPARKEFLKQVYGVLNDEIESGIARVGLLGERLDASRIGDPESFVKALRGTVRSLQEAGEDPKVGKALVEANFTPKLDKFIKTKQQFGDLEAAESIAKKSAARDAKNNDFGLTSYIMGGGIGSALGASTGDSDNIVPGAIAGMVGREGFRRYGNTTGAVILNGISNLLKRDPEKLGKYAGVLSNAASRGQAALMATHGILMQRDGDYRKIFDEIPGVTKLKKDLDNSLTENVVDPMARRGMGTAGAAIATVGSTLAEALIPSTPTDFMPSSAAIHLGAYPFLKYLGAKEGKEIRSSLKQIGHIAGQPHIMATKTQKGAEDIWNIFDHSGEKPMKIGQVLMEWKEGSPVVQYIENKSHKTSKGHQRGIIADFLDKFADRAGEVTSSMEFEATGNRFLGAEMWEKKLPRVVEVADGPGKMYRMLSKERFGKWLDNQPQTFDGYKGVLNGAETAAERADLHDFLLKNRETYREMVNRYGQDVFLQPTAEQLKKAQ